MPVHSTDFNEEKSQKNLIVKFRLLSANKICPTVTFEAVSGSRIRMFLILPDPNPLFRGMDPDPAPSPHEGGERTACKIKLLRPVDNVPAGKLYQIWRKKIEALKSLKKGVGSISHRKCPGSPTLLRRRNNWRNTTGTLPRGCSEARGPERWAEPSPPALQAWARDQNSPRSSQCFHSSFLAHLGLENQSVFRGYGFNWVTGPWIRISKGPNVVPKKGIQYN